MMINEFRFLMETDHRTYITCRCGTSMPEQPFEEIWNVLMPMLNQMEALLACLTPSKLNYSLISEILNFIFFFSYYLGNHFERSVQCVHCKEFSFMVISGYSDILISFNVLFFRVNGQHLKNYNV